MYSVGRAASVIQCGKWPFLECSSAGDSRFSAFHARLKYLGNQSIEELYQAHKIFSDGATGLHWRVAKERQRRGQMILNMDACRIYYSVLWNSYIAENPELLPVLVEATGLSDMYGRKGHVCQAIELWRIRSYAVR